MALEPPLRARIQVIRLALLDLHKLLLERERNIYERDHGAIGSPGEFLTLVLENPQFSWLRNLSGLIVEMDELLSTRTKSGDADGQAVIFSVRNLLRLSENGNQFQLRYYAAIQDSPDVVIAHCKAEQLVRLD